MKEKINRRELMKNAWRTYKYGRRGRSFGEVLKATWMLAKVQLGIDRMDAEREAKKAETAKKVAIIRIEQQRNREIAKMELEKEKQAAAKYGMTLEQWNDAITGRGTRLYNAE